MYEKASRKELDAWSDNGSGQCDAFVQMIKNTLFGKESANPCVETTHDMDDWEDVQEGSVIKLFESGKLICRGPVTIKMQGNKVQWSIPNLLTNKDCEYLPEYLDKSKMHLIIEKVKQTF